jgi:hypothetical protein
MPAGDLDGEIVASLGSQPCPGRVDQELARLGSEPIGAGDPHGPRLSRRRNACSPRTGPDFEGRSRGHRSRHWGRSPWSRRAPSAPLRVAAGSVSGRPTPRDRKVARHPCGVEPFAPSRGEARLSAPLARWGQDGDMPIRTRHRGRLGVPRVALLGAVAGGVLLAACTAANSPSASPPGTSRYAPSLAPTSTAGARGVELGVFEVSCRAWLVR